MFTKLDALKRNAQERKQRLQNVLMLNRLLAEAKETYEVIPNDHQFETQQERVVVQKRIDFLADFVADEVKAMEELTNNEAALNIERLFEEMGEPTK